MFGKRHRDIPVAEPDTPPFRWAYAGQPRELNCLALEDNFADYDALRRNLSKVEYFKVKVTRARTLEEARLMRSHQDFDIAFIDYNLGMESGVRFMQEIGGRNSRTVPILVTGLHDHHVQEIALKAGAISIINKMDMTPTLLETTIRSAFYTQEIEQELCRVITLMAAT